MSTVPNSKIIKIASSFAGIALLAVFSWYAYTWYTNSNMADQESPLPNDYLIPDVPYRGIYTDRYAASTNVGIAEMMLAYYGDPRLSIVDLARTFIGADNQPPAIDITLEQFFSQYGYSVEAFPVATVDDIKPYIVADRPVVIFQRFTKDTPDSIHTARVVIGFDDATEEVTVHDVTFGNNMVFGYEEFSVLNLYSPQFAFVLDTNTLTDVSLSPVREPYQERIEIMDDIEVREALKRWTVANFYVKDAYIAREQGAEDLEQGPLFEKAARSFVEVMEEPGFKKLHPALQYNIAFELGKVYTSYLDMHEEAAAVFRDVMIPLSDEQDFTVSQNGWPGLTEYQYQNTWWQYAGWMGYGIALVRMGQIEAAEEPFRKVQAVEPNQEDAVAYFNGEYDRL